jgi:hypothetical protein
MSNQPHQYCFRPYRPLNAGFDTTKKRHSRTKSGICGFGSGENDRTTELFWVLQRIVSVRDVFGKWTYITKSNLYL